jgi:hypothetical protein
MSTEHNIAALLAQKMLQTILITVKTARSKLTILCFVYTHVRPSSESLRNTLIFFGLKMTSLGVVHNYVPGRQRKLLY